jgi:hypothetical protein
MSIGNDSNHDSISIRTFLTLVTKITMIAKVSTGTFLNLVTNVTKAITKSMVKLPPQSSHDHRGNHSHQRNTGKLGNNGNLSKVCNQSRFLLFRNVKQSYMYVGKSKGKAIPVPAWIGSEGFRKFRLPEFKTISTSRWQSCLRYAPAALSQEVFLVLISVRG